MRVLVCGGREFDDWIILDVALLDLEEEAGGRKITCVIQGGAKGADFLGRVWAKYWNVEMEEYKPDWNTFGKAAGPIRNKQMIKEGKPDYIVACKGGRGTKSMVELAERARIPVKKVGW